MARRLEWTEWHLTPRGWERGSTRVRGRGNQWTDEPQDRALSFVYKEVEGSASETTQSSEETWRPRGLDGLPAPLSPETKELLSQHGPCPQSL
ncbi:MAG TPA: hypothetical protein VGD59_12215 [Acidisarcina sp.]